MRGLFRTRLPDGGQARTEQTLGLSHACVLPLVIVAVVALPPGAVAKQRVVGGRVGVGVTPGSGPAADAPVLIEPPAPILNLFARAREGVDRRDWKFAIDSLQRIIDDPGGSLVPRDGTIPPDMIVYESTRHRALRILLGLGPEAMRAYRILYDGRAKGLYDRAVASGAIEPLRKIINQYPLSRYGDDACDTLASWLIDEGRYGETIDVLQDCLSIVVDFDVPRQLLEGKLAAALAASGRQREAVAVAARTEREAGGAETAPAWVEAITAGAIEPGPPDGTRGAESGASIASTPGPASPGPPVHATLVDPVPWRYDLPGNAALIWKRIVHDAPDDPVMIPAVRGVTNGSRLFVRRPSGCAALDLDDLDVAWESSGNADARGSPLGDEREDWAAGGGFEDYIGGSLALAEGRLLTVEWRGSPSEESMARAQQLLRTRAAMRSLRSSANRLVAYDPDTGEIVWQRGRTFDTDDPLGEVEFRAAPLGVEGRLWVPVVVQRDLFLCVLDPSDGSLVQRIPLGSFQNFDRPRGRMLEPTYGDGLVFVPSSRGVLFAVDAHTRALRWATRYAVPEPVVDTQHQPRRRGRGQNRRGAPVVVQARAPTNTLPDAPVLARGLVLVLSESGGALIALSASEGLFRWATPAQHAAYVIGADDERVWLGGRSIQCVSLADGARVWETPIHPAPTGWAVLAGGLVHIPTAEGLLTLDRATGARVRLDTLPADQTPLGNLLATADSLYSIEPSSVRKFPDIERTYARAKERYTGHPSDVRSALRLAWMELFRDEPSHAFEILDRLPASAIEADERRVETVAHVRVAALQAMAEESSRDDEHALALLERARSLARGAHDRLHVGLAVADRQRVLRRSADAYASLWALGLSDAANETITINDAVETAARLEIARRMRAIEPDVSPTAAARVIAQGLKIVDRAASAARSTRGAARLESLATLRAVAELGTPPSVSARALLDWADLEAEARRYERSDQLLRWCGRLFGDPQHKTAALLRLFAVYRAEIGPQAAPTLDVLHVLERDFGAVPVSADLAARLGFEGAANEGTTIASWVQRTRAAAVPPTDDDRLSVAPVTTSEGYVPLTAAWALAPKTFQSNAATAPFPLVGDLRQSLLGVPVAETPRLINFDEPARSFMHDRILFHAGGDVVYCQRPRDGALLWQTSLREPEDFDESLDVARGRSRDRMRRAVSDGQVAVVNGTDGLYALGVLTGRRLWMRPYESRSRPGTEAPLDWRMAARDGLLAAMPNNGRLTLMRILDGSTVWERDLRGEVVATISMTEDRVVTASPRLERVMIFDRTDGAEVARHVFRQPDPGTRPVMLVQTGSVLCGPDVADREDAVLALRLEDGVEAWRHPCRKPVVRLFEPTDGLVGIGLLGGDLLILEAETGAVVLNQHVPGAQIVSDGRVIDATLLVQALTLQTAKRQPVLIAIDLATGAELWRRTDLWPGTAMELPLVVHDGVTPAIVAYNEPGLNQNQSRVGLALIDSVTGKTRGFAREVLPPRSRSQLNGDVAVLSDATVLGTSLGIQAFRATAERDSDEGS